MKEQHQRKLYANNILMTEHELKVNGDFIKAYENMDPTIHENNRLLGVKAAEDIAKLSPTRAWKKSGGDSIIGKSSGNIRDGGISEQSHGSSSIDNYKSELAKKLNQEVFYKPKEGYVPPSPPKISSKLAEIVAKNMEDPNILAMRSNTHNLMYGYRPGMNNRSPAKNRLGKNVENNKSMALPENRTAAEENPKSDYISSSQPPQKPLNKSFAQPVYDPLADAAKEVLGDQVQSLEVEKRSASVDRASQVTNSPRCPPEYNEYQNNMIPKGMGRFKAAGASRRQIVNYNIITGAGK